MSKKKEMKIYNGFCSSFVKIGRAKDFLFDFINYCNNYGYDLNTSSIEQAKKVQKTIDKYIDNRALTTKQNGIFFPFNIGNITIYNTHDLEIYNETLKQINKMRK